MFINVFEDLEISGKVTERSTFCHLFPPSCLAPSPVFFTLLQHQGLIVSPASYGSYSRARL